MLLLKTMMLTEFFPSPARPARHVSSVRHCRGERRISALWSALIPPTLSPPLCIAPTSTQKCEALHCCTLKQLPPAAAVYSPEQTGARRQELLHHPALTGGKTPSKHVQLQPGGQTGRLGSYQGDMEYARRCRYTGHDNRKHLHAEICKHWSIT